MTSPPIMNYTDLRTLKNDLTHQMIGELKGSRVRTTVSTDISSQQLDNIKQCNGCTSRLDIVANASDVLNELAPHTCVNSDDTDGVNSDAVDDDEYLVEDEYLVDEDCSDTCLGRWNDCSLSFNRLDMYFCDEQIHSHFFLYKNLIFI